MNCEINTRTELMSHQRDAVSKMMNVRVGALFMEEGTGRTRIVIELVKLRSSRISNVVWFCPYSIQRNIRAEIEKHCGSVGDFWNIISMESMSTGVQGIISAFRLVQESSYVIVDESHYIKGPHTKRSARIIRVAAKAYYRLILSETPVTQGVQDLYTQFYFLSERILGYNSYYAFLSNHLEFSREVPQKVVRAHNMEYLAAKIEPYVYQKTRRECCELPDKIYSMRYFRMSSEQKLHYQNLKREILEDFCFSNNTIFLLFVRLQQILSGFRKRQEEDVLLEKNPRLEALDELLYSLPDNVKIVIWAKFRYDLLAIRRILPDHASCFLHGKNDSDTRQKQLNFFHQEGRFLVLNEKMEKYNLDLSCADVVIFYNNSFSYTNRLRAENLCRGKKEKKKILYIDLICSNSIDERIQQNLSGKKHIAVALRENMKKIRTMEDRRKWMEDL